MAIDEVDYYGAAETAVVNLLKNYEGMAPFIKPATKDKQVTKSDDTVLTFGFDYFAITYPGSFPTIEGGTGVIETVWDVYIDLFARFVGDEKTFNERLKPFRSAVFNMFKANKNKRLNGAPYVKTTTFGAELDPQFYYSKGTDAATAQPVFLSQRTKIAVTHTIMRKE